MTASSEPTTPPSSRMALAARIITVVGGAVIVISSFLTWKKKFVLGPRRGGFDDAAKFLIDDKARPGGVSVGVVVLIVGLLTIGAAFVGPRRILSVVLGLVAGGIGALWVFQLHRQIVDVFHSKFGLRRIVGVGPFVAAVGGGIAVIGGLIEFVPRFLGPAEEEEEEPEGSPGASPAP